MSVLLDFRDPDTARTLSQSLPEVVSMLEQAAVSRRDQAFLLQLSPQTIRRAIRLDGAFLPTRTPDQITRMGYLTGIVHTAREQMDHAEARDWLHRPQPRLDGLTPVRYMCQRGIPGMIDVQEILSASGAHISAVDLMNRDLWLLQRVAQSIPTSPPSEN